MVDDRAPAGGEDDGDEAAKAFDALRKSIDRRNTATTAELKTIRKGVEALFDQIEALQAKPDFAADLAQLKQIESRRRQTAGGVGGLASSEAGHQCL